MKEILIIIREKNDAITPGLKKFLLLNSVHLLEKEDTRERKFQYIKSRGFLFETFTQISFTC